MLISNTLPKRRRVLFPCRAAARLAQRGTDALACGDEGDGSRWAGAAVPMLGLSSPSWKAAASAGGTSASFGIPWCPSMSFDGLQLWCLVPASFKPLEHPNIQSCPMFGMVSTPAPCSSFFQALENPNIPDDEEGDEEDLIPAQQDFASSTRWGAEGGPHTSATSTRHASDVLIKSGGEGWIRGGFPFAP